MAFLYRTPSTAGNRKTWTFSAWVKRSKISINFPRMFSSYQSNNDRFEILFTSSDTITLESIYGASQTLNLQTARKFRDSHGFYHIVVAVDTTQATASDRVKLYVNGVQETEFTTSTYMSQNENTSTNDTYIQYVGETGYSGGGQEFSGYMSHVHLIDGTAYDASAFGSTDSTTGIWKPKTNPSVTYGTNGFFLDFADSSNLGNDISGNNNDYSMSGTIYQSLTTPSNIFCTFNGVADVGGDHTLVYGGTGVAFQETSGDARQYGNLAFSKGKYYWEWKAISEHPSANTWGIGSVDDLYNQESPGGNNKHWVMNAANKYNGSATAWGSQVNIGEIGMVAVDMDNGKIWFGKDGTWFESGNPSTGANPAFSNVTDVTVTPIAADNTSTFTPQQHYNFGEGRFGGTAVASAGSNSGLGTFEFDVPTGFKALCTKSINEQEYS